MIRTYKLIAEPKQKQNLQKVVRYVYIEDGAQEHDLKLSKAMEEFERDFSPEDYILRTWEQGGF